jgi:hypothetical protein
LLPPTINPPRSAIATDPARSSAVVVATPTPPAFANSGTVEAQSPIEVSIYDGGLAVRQQRQDRLRKERLASIEKDFGDMGTDVKK